MSFHKQFGNNMNKKHEAILRILASSATPLTVADIGDFLTNDERGLIGDNKSLSKIMPDLRKKEYVDVSEQEYINNQARFFYFITQAGRNALEAIYAKPEDRSDNDEDWIGWNGGECPLDDGVMHQVKLRTGEISKIVVSRDDVSFYQHVNAIVNLYGAAMTREAVVKTPENLEGKIKSLKHVAASPFDAETLAVLSEVIKDYEAMR
jgi:DNA-binding PadR family transcriptional regulator